jgi:flagellar assembly protein FliH
MLERSQQEKEEAYKNGYSDGLQMGTAKGQEEAARISGEFNQLITDVQNQRGEIFRQAEREIVELALAIARRIISVHAESTPEIVIDSARKAVKLLLDKTNLVVKVAPEQEMFIKENLDRLYEMDDRIQKIDVETDRRVGPGGCMLDTESGNVDARIETELQNIEDALRNTNLNQPED